MNWRTATMSALTMLLLDIYSPAEVEAWFTSPHPMLGNVSPIDAMESGRFDDVLRLIEQIRESTYT